MKNTSVSKNVIQEETDPNLMEVGSIVRDPESGREIIASPGIIQDLFLAEQSINFALGQLAVSLKRIRDERLYLLRNTRSFKEYVENYISFSYRHVSRIVSIADSFSGSDRYDQIAQLPLSFLQHAEKDQNLYQQLKRGEFTDNEGNTYSLTELLQMSQNEMNTELKKLLAKNAVLKKQIKEVSQRATENEKLVQHYESSSGKEVLNKIVTREDALREIEYSRGVLADITNKLSAIELDDISVIRELSGVVTGGIAALSVIQDAYLPSLNAAPEIGD